MIENIIDFKDYIQESEPYGKSFQWKVSGNPFEGGYSSDQRIMMHLLTKILRRMNVSGWKLVASADISAKYIPNTKYQSPKPLDNHSWFFLKDPTMILPPETIDMKIKEVDTKEKVPEIMVEHDPLDDSLRKEAKQKLMIFVIFGSVATILLIFFLS